MENYDKFYTFETCTPSPYPAIVVAVNARKKATHSAQVLVTRSAWLVRCGYHATSN
jgi:hypothetical protein